MLEVGETYKVGELEVTVETIHSVGWTVGQWGSYTPYVEFTCTGGERYRCTLGERKPIESLWKLVEDD